MPAISVRETQMTCTHTQTACCGLPSASSANTHHGGAEFLHTDSVLVVDLVGGGKGVVGLRLEAWQVLRGARVQSRATRRVSTEGRGGRTTRHLGAGIRLRAASKRGRDKHIRKYKPATLGG